jgi:hypothetical protein
MLVLLIHTIGWIFRFCVQITCPFCKLSMGSGPFGVWIRVPSTKLVVQALQSDPAELLTLDFA